MKIDMGQEWMVSDPYFEADEEIDDLDTMENHEALLEGGEIDSAEDGFIRGYTEYAET